MRLDKQINNQATLAKVHCYATAQYACSYLPKLQSRSQVAVLEPAQAPAAYSVLIRHGFRRSGVHVYRPQCASCQACQSARIRVVDFAPSRSQKRAAKVLSTLTVKTLPLAFQADHWDLYQRYQATRHPDDGSQDTLSNTNSSTSTEDSENSAQAYSQLLLRSHVDSCMVEFRIKAGEHAGRLYAVSIVDIVSDGLSAVYTFFEPTAPYAKGSPGTACVIWMVSQARALGLAYVYLGYWIKDSRKMAYKVNFQALEILQNGLWLSHTGDS